jgi:hypothetical protein
MTSNNDKSRGDAETLLPQGCKPVAACLDYRAYIFALPRSPGGAAYEHLRDALCALGRCEPPRLGVHYVYADWGFLVVPPPGFPELKINFFRHTGTDRIATLLHRVASLIDRMNSP